MARLLSLLLVVTALCGSAAGQAFCALRDPNRQLYDLYPEATSYRSIVRIIDEDARERVAERLPFTLHFNELGRHTLYVPMRESAVMGLVHVRSESGRWGLVEVAWALDLDLKVRDFRFQRCRDRQRKALEEEEVKAALEGLDFQGLRALLDEEGLALKPDVLPVSPEAADLAVTLVRNGLKTIAATRAAWEGDLVTLRAHDVAQRLAGTTRSVARVKRVYDAALIERLADRVGDKGTGIRRSRTAAWTARDKEGHVLGCVLATSWRHSEHTAHLIWSVDTDGHVREVANHDGWGSKEVGAQFQKQVGRSLEDFEVCAGIVDLTALEVLVTAGSVLDATTGQ